MLGNAQVPNAFPIVYSSDGFCDLSGYPRAYIMQKGCACKFLYGPGTDEEKRTEIEKALEAKTELQVEVQFYKTNGEKFYEKPLPCIQASDKYDPAKNLAIQPLL